MQTEHLMPTKYVAFLVQHMRPFLSFSIYVLYREKDRYSSLDS